MNKLNLLLVTTILLLLFIRNSAVSAEQEELEEITEEYCHSETFQPRCMKNEIIFMKNATYGRMHSGRCITEAEIESLQFLQSGYIGCSADVLPLLDQKCSGKTECEVRVAEIANENIQPCRPGLNAFLEVVYKCLPIVDDRRSCAVDVSKSPIHLISSSACGTNSQPWTIEVPYGQQVKVDLLEFTLTVPIKQSCQQRGVIMDKVGRRNTSICVGGGQREKNLLLSEGNSVQIVFSQREETKSSETESVLLKLQAVGCTNIIPPVDGYSKRNGNSITVGCYTSRKTWHLNCQHGIWVGVIGNCSQGSILLDSTVESQAESATANNEQVLALVALAGFTLAICLVIICLGILCLRRIHRNGASKKEYKTLNYPTNSNINQPTDQTVHDLMSRSLRNDMHGSVGPHMPTYSVYVGHDGSNHLDE